MRFSPHLIACFSSRMNNQAHNILDTLANYKRSCSRKLERNTMVSVFTSLFTSSILSQTCFAFLFSLFKMAIMISLPAAIKYHNEFYFARIIVLCRTLQGCSHTLCLHRPSFVVKAFPLLMTEHCLSSSKRESDGNQENQRYICVVYNP